MSQGFFGGEQSLYYPIGSIRVKRVGGLTRGYIQFAPTGGIQSRRGLLKETEDPNVVFFRARDDDLVRQIEAYVDQRIQQS